MTISNRDQLVTFLAQLANGDHKDKDLQVTLQIRTPDTTLVQRLSGGGVTVSIELRGPVTVYVFLGPNASVIRVTASMVKSIQVGSHAISVLCTCEGGPS